MRGMVADTEGALDHQANTGAGPALTAQAVGCGAATEQLGQLGQLVGREARRRTTGDAAAQCICATGLGTLEPLADGTLGDAKCFGDAGLAPALLM